MHFYILCNEFGITSRCFAVTETSFCEIGGLLAKCEAPGHTSELKPQFWMQNAGLEGPHCCCRARRLLLSSSAICFWCACHELGRISGKNSKESGKIKSEMMRRARLVIGWFRDAISCSLFSSGGDYARHPHPRLRRSARHVVPRLQP